MLTTIGLEEAICRTNTPIKIIRLNDENMGTCIHVKEIYPDDSMYEISDGLSEKANRFMRSLDDQYFGLPRLKEAPASTLDACTTI